MRTPMALLSALLALAECAGPDAVTRADDANERLRLIIETDAGGDPDDEQSLVRFLLYTCEWDVEGIIANRAQTRRPENRHPAETGLAIVRASLDAYSQCYRNLVEHDLRYPRPEVLRARTVPGYDDVTDAVNLIIEAVDRADRRPVWYADWGSDHGAATVNLQRALDRVWQERGASGYAKFKNRLRIIGANPFGPHTGRAPDWRLWVNTFQPTQNGLRWYHRFSALTARAGGFDLQRDVLAGHGPLGALYPTNTTHRQKEGDSMTFLYLVPTGMNDPEEPGWGSWAGRYGLDDRYPGKPFYWANQADAWQGTTNRDNTLARWAVALQNDFRARLNWCVRHRSEANHAPMVVLNGVRGDAPLQFHAPIGSEVTLDAIGTSDPDGNTLRYAWSTYVEPGTCPTPVILNPARGPRTRFRFPASGAETTLHVLLTVTDDGDPPLTRYGRAVITGQDLRSAERIFQPFLQPPPEWAGQLGSFRSPLVFADGTRVETPAQWSRRRAEIAAQWNELLGPWPALLDAPRVTVKTERRRDNFIQRRVVLEIGPEQTGEGWLLIPPGRGPFPAVLVVYYEPETSVGLNPEQPQRDFGRQLARRGFVTLSIGTPGGNAWQPATGPAACQPLAYHAYVAANCWRVLAAMPQVDRERIGVVGHSYGGKWALFAGAFWEKFAAVAVSDPGIVWDETRPNVNYWEPWYLGLDPREKRPQAGLPTATNPRTGAYKKLREQEHDLHELHALIAPRPFLVSGGAEDPPSRWMALNHLLGLNRILGFTNRVALTSRREHSPDENSNRQLYAFFEHFLGTQGTQAPPGRP